MQMSVGRASLFMIVTLVASRLLGWIRLSVIGAKFAGTPDLDAYLAAFRIPDTLFNLLVAGALASAFIPVFTSYLAKDREDEAWRVASSVMNAIVISLVVLSGVLWLLAPWIQPVLADFPDPAQRELSVRLARIMLLSPIFMGLSALFTGILNSYRQFLSGAMAPLVYNFVIVLFAVFAAPFLGIEALAWGTVAGALMMWLVQVPELTFRRTRYKLALDLSHAGVREIVRLTIPRTLALGAVQLIFIVDTFLAARMSGGSLTALIYAQQLMQLPLGVFSIAISAAVFPTLAHYAAQGLQAKMRDILQTGIRWILFLTLPTVVMMIVLRRPIVNLLFQYGQFGAQAREATQEAFLFYSLGLAGHALIQILTRAYYASKDTRTPLALTLVSIGTNIVLSVLLAPRYGINGLALANSIATLAEAALFLALLAPRARLRIVGLGTASMKVVAASLLMGIAMFEFIRATNITVDLQQTKLGLLLQTLVAVAVGGLAYVGAATAFRVHELAEITAAVRSRLGRRGP
ncbi:MAG: murein biosynthesis integral membrane protein MurJ [Candidatus Limnocylindria bacterium]